MDTVELLAKFADPEVIQTLSTMDRLMAGLITTILGMGITFIALVVLQFVIGLMAKISQDKPAAIEQVDPQKPVAIEQPEAAVKLKEKDEELVAAITTAIAMQLRTSVSKIVIRNIEKIEESTSTWQKTGIAEHMNNSL